MPKQTLRDTPIESMPKGETVLLEGIMQSVSIYKTTSSVYPYKYVITDKGVWTKSKKMLFMKSVEGFLGFSELEGYKKMKYGGADCFIFYPVSGRKPSTRVFFDDPAAVTEILNKYLKRVDRAE